MGTRESPAASGASSAHTLLIAGTASHVGKSTVAAGLCRLLADRGVSVAPYKAQNMSNNARVVVRAAGTEIGPESGVRSNAEWGEIGVSQFVQARAARITPTTDCNPVLLKPRGDGESQLVVDGRAVGHYSAGSYYEDHWERARDAAEAAHARLADEYDVVIAEGAGSIAEINLHDRDLANVETARFADADVLLLVDIERGGAFASLYGTIELLPEDLRERVVGAVITKFRGDASLLEPGIAEIESRTGVPVLGVLPYDDPGLPEEDSVSLPGTGERAIVGGDGRTGRAERSVTIAVPRFPRISNATDLEALAERPGVRLEYVPLEERGSDSGGGDSSAGGAEATRESSAAAIATADAVVLPGTKNTVDDLRALVESPVGNAIRRFDGPIVGICGGYQMLGERIRNAGLEGTGVHKEETVDGLGLLPVETTFHQEKRLERTTVEVDGAGPIAGASGTASGYEIHAGRTRVLADGEATIEATTDATSLDPDLEEGAETIVRPLGSDSVASGNVLGTYLHGLFDNRTVREAFLESVFERTGVERPRAAGDEARTPFDDAARLVAENVDLERLGEQFVE